MITNPPLPGGRTKLTPLDVIEIKALLWEGLPQSLIATQLNISQPTVSNIRRGSQWPLVQWPDGSEGPIPLARWQELNKPKQRRRQQQQEDNNASDEARLAAEEVEARTRKKEEEEEEALYKVIKKTTTRTQSQIN